jgi:ferredoxin
MSYTGIHSNEIHEGGGETIRNARLPEAYRSSTVRRVHIALIGIEKLIPRLADLGIFLRLLGRSATGQKLTTYTSLLTGPRRRGEDGLEEMHVVMVDNGRAKSLADPKMREMLYCIRCGACLNTCPVYRKIGGHAYGWVYSGPIGAPVTPEFLGIGQARELPFASSLCGACREVCPVKINIPDLLLHLRSEAREYAPKPSQSLLPERLMFRLWLGECAIRPCMRWAAGWLAGGKSCWRARVGFGKFRRTRLPSEPRSATSPRLRRKRFATAGKSFRFQLSGVRCQERAKIEIRKS